MCVCRVRGAMCTHVSPNRACNPPATATLAKQSSAAIAITDNPLAEIMVDDLLPPAEDASYLIDVGRLVGNKRATVLRLLLMLPMTFACVKWFGISTALMLVLYAFCSRHCM